MNIFIRLTVVLGFVSAVAAGALALTYGKTKDRIAEQEKAVKVNALKGIFFDGFERTQDIDSKTTAVFLEGDGDVPSYYAVVGDGIGYNTGVPISLLVGFSNPAKGGDKAEAKSKIIGWMVIRSEETPGLGEKAKESKAPYTWAEKVSGSAKEAGPDARTDFQKQFAGLSVDELKLSKDGGSIDTITAATYTTVGIIKAIENAHDNLDASLAQKK